MTIMLTSLNCTLTQTLLQKLSLGMPEPQLSQKHGPIDLCLLQMDCSLFSQVEWLDLGLLQVIKCTNRRRYT